METTALEAVLRHDRRVVLASLAALTILAWGYLLWLAEAMSMSPVLRPWGAAKFGTMFVMWTIMMVGMMTPSAAPMVLLYVRVGRQAAARGRPLAATVFFAAGYLLAWTAFSAAATLAQWGLARGLATTPAMAGGGGLFAGLVLVIAGVYQWTPLKQTCLRHCQAPLIFIQRHGGFRRDVPGALAIGVRHGAYCVGCCWALMTLLFVVGVMNLAGVAALAVLVLAEKLLPAGWHFDRIVGSLLLAVGGWLTYITMG